MSRSESYTVAKSSKPNDLEAKPGVIEGQEQILAGFSPEEREKLDVVLKRLEAIAQIVGGDVGMKVRIGEPGGGSFFDMKEVTITFDPLHILKNENEAAFEAGHEGSHRAISRLATAFGHTSQQINEMYGQIGFGYMHNAIEDPAVNDWMSKKFLGLRNVAQEMYDKQFAKENAELGTPEVVAIARKLGYWPKFAQFGSEVIRHWHQGRYSATLDPDVKRALTMTEYFFDRSRTAIPSTTAWDEGAIVRCARRRYETNNEHVWPEVKRLVELDLKIEAGKQAMKDMLKKAATREEQKRTLENEFDPARREQIEREISTLDKELKQFDQLKQAMEQAMKEMAERLEQAQKATDEEIQQGQKGGQEQETPEGGAEADREKQRGENERQIGYGSDGEEGRGMPDRLSRDEEELLKRVQRSLPKEVLEQYEKVAREALEDLEDALNEGMQGELNDKRPKSHETQRTEREIQERQAAEQTRREDHVRKIRELLDKRRQESMTPYEHIRQSAKPIADYLFNNLMSVLHPEETGGEESELPWGEKLDMARVAQSEADFRQKLKLWTREVTPEARDYAFQLCLDYSGSTSGIIEEEKIGLLAVSDALRRLEEYNTDKVNIRHSLSAFSNDYTEYKDFKTRMNLRVAEKVANISAKGNTNTLEAVQRELDRAFAEGAESGNFVLVISDGQPNHDIRSALTQLLADTRKRRQEERVHVILVWIGDGTEKKALDAECRAIVAEYGFDAGLALNATAGSGGHHFGKELSKLIKDIVGGTRA